MLKFFAYGTRMTRMGHGFSRIFPNQKRIRENPCLIRVIRVPSYLSNQPPRFQFQIFVDGVQRQVLWLGQHGLDAILAKPGHHFTFVL
jgi:hypothetical protein